MQIEEQLIMMKKKLFRPFSSSAEVKCRMCSEPLERVIVDFGADVSYEKASEKISEHYSVEVPISTIRNVTQKHAKNMSQLKNTYVNNQKANCIVGSVDGVMVPIVDIDNNSCNRDLRKTRKTCWHECRLSLACKKGSLSPIYDATMGSIDDAGKMLKDCVDRIGLADKGYLQIVADGAPWIEDQVEKNFGDKAVFLIDFYHVSQYISGAGRCCCPDNPLSWLHYSQGHLKNSYLEPVLEKLRIHCEEGTCQEKDACPAKKCLNYMEKRLNHFDYKSAIEQGLPIGSGAIESGNRHVVQARLKLAGAWWRPESAQNMLDLRTFRANGNWDTYWISRRLENNHF